MMFMAMRWEMREAFPDQYYIFLHFSRGWWSMLNLAIWQRPVKAFLQHEIDIKRLFQGKIV